VWVSGGGGFKTCKTFGKLDGGCYVTGKEEGWGAFTFRGGGYGEGTPFIHSLL